MTTLKFFDECAVKGFSGKRNIRGWDSRIQHQLAAAMIWDRDMTEEEYYGASRQLLERNYGGGWLYPRVHRALRNRDSHGQCTNCWAYNVLMDDGQFNKEYCSENFDRMAELLEAAVTLADSSLQERRCEALTIHMYYEGCYSDYLTAYEANDEARLAVLNERYDLLIERLRRLNLGDPATGVAFYDSPFADNLYDARVTTGDYSPKHKPVPSPSSPYKSFRRRGCGGGRLFQKGTLPRDLSPATFPREYFGFP